MPGEGRTEAAGRWHEPARSCGVKSTRCGSCGGKLTMPRQAGSHAAQHAVATKAQISTRGDALCPQGSTTAGCLAPSLDEMAVYRALAGDQVTAAGRRVGAALAARCRSNAAPPLLLHPNAATAGSVGRVLSAAGVQSEAQGPLRLNGRACSPSTEVQAWDCLEVPGVEGPRAWGAGRFTVPPILAWNRNFIAMAKPAGMLSQPVRDAAGHATWPVEFGEGFAGCPPGAGLSVEEVANACSTLVQGKRGHALHLLHRIDR